MFGVLFVIAQLQIGYCQSINKIDSICWCDNYKLRWSDFKSEPPKGAEWSATTFALLNIDGYKKGGIPNYQVTNYFLKLKSWSNDTVSTTLLDHERLHFDIAEVFARKIRLAVESLRKKGEMKMEIYDSTIQQILNARRILSATYDEETSHGLRTSKQQEWSTKIQKELNVLSKYATKCPTNNTP
jgi:hypothetical protein